MIGVLPRNPNIRTPSQPNSTKPEQVTTDTNHVVEEMNSWMSRPLKPIHATIFIDAIVVKFRDGQVRNQPYYAAIGINLEGHKDMLGIWPGNGEGKSAKFWFACLTELKNRGVKDMFFIFCDGLKGGCRTVSARYSPTLRSRRV